MFRTAYIVLLTFALVIQTGVYCSVYGDAYTRGRDVISDGKQSTPYDVFLGNHGMGHVVRLLGSQNGFQDNIVRSAVLYRLMGEQVGRKILDSVERKIDDRTYNFQTAVLRNPWAGEYIDDDGKLKGFVYDLVKEVCKEAGKKCEIVYDRSQHCCSHIEGDHARAGKGLLGRVYDGCLTWFKTSGRQLSLSFSEPYMKYEDPARFYVKVGNPLNFDPYDITATKIGLINGWSSDIDCVRKAQYDVTGLESLNTSHVVYAHDFEHTFQNLHDDKVAAVFVYSSAFDSINPVGYEAIGEGILCVDGKIHMMTRKDSDVLEWFDSTLKAMKENGKYYRLCQKAHKEHAEIGPLLHHCLE